jgi:hypothetical protein
MLAARHRMQVLPHGAGALEMERPRARIIQGFLGLLIVSLFACIGVNSQAANSSGNNIQAFLLGRARLRSRFLKMQISD